MVLPRLSFLWKWLTALEFKVKVPLQIYDRALNKYLKKFQNGLRDLHNKSAQKELLYSNYDQRNLFPLSCYKWYSLCCYKWYSKWVITESKPQQSLVDRIIEHEGTFFCKIRKLEKNFCHLVLTFFYFFPFLYSTSIFSHVSSLKLWGQ